MNPLVEQINNSGYELFFLVVDNTLDINLYPLLKNFRLIYAYQCDQTNQFKLTKTPYFCLEEQGYHLEEKNTGRLLAHPQVKNYIKLSTQNSGNKAAIIPFKPSAKIDTICRKEGWLNIGNPASLNRFFEDKIKFVKLLNDHNLPFVPSVVDKFNQENFNKYQTLFGSKLVLQTHFGWAGNSTFLSSTYPEAAVKIPENVIVKFSPHLNGYSLLNNCCITQKGLIQSPPALQYTGIKPFTKNPFTTVGRQWPCMAPGEIQNRVFGITQNFGEILKQYNYKGFFGLDFLISQNQVYLLECNPRLTASFAFYTQMELQNNLTPLFLYHLAEFLNIDYQVDIESENSRFSHPGLIGSEITLKDKNNITKKKYNAFRIFTETYDPINIKEEVFTQMGLNYVSSQKT